MATDPNDVGDLKVDVARRLRQTRDALDLQQNEFAEEIGIGRSTYNLIEKGRRKITIAVLIAITNRFAVTTDWILIGDPSGLRTDIFQKIRNSDVR